MKVEGWTLDVLEAIKTRRSIGLVSDKPVSNDLVEQILEAGTWAPCHFKTEPWRFFVLTGDGRKPLGNTLAEIAEEKMEQPLSESDEKKLEKVKEKPFRAPLLIVVAVEPSNNPKVIELEEYGAVYASIQNMLLATHSLGLAGFWRTGSPTYDERVRNLFGLSKNGKVLGFLYVGYPKRDIHEGKRKAIQEVTKWFNKEEDFS